MLRKNTPLSHGPRHALLSALFLTLAYSFHTFDVYIARGFSRAIWPFSKHQKDIGSNELTGPYRRNFRSVSATHQTLRDENQDDQEEELSTAVPRRSIIKGMVLASLSTPLAAFAGQPELDSSGMLYSPKSEMFAGGTQAARGIKVDASRPDGVRLKPGQALQSVYGTRFIAYLSRFLLNFDPAARAWGFNNGLVGDDRSVAENKFAEFAESVEVGLADYFVGPYGSYSSVLAARAGVSAASPVRSAQPLPTERSLIERLFGIEANIEASKDSVKQAKQGVLNLLALLKARYTSTVEKAQLAILFSFISSESLQPTAEIRSLLGEVCNASIAKVSILRPEKYMGQSEFRMSSRLGGGYSLSSEPYVYIEAPPALGDTYRPAKLQPIMESTSRILRIVVTDGGEGYTSSPPVSVFQVGCKRLCQACAILDRAGHVESIIVLDPGLGYREGKDGTAPKVKISPPKLKRGEEIATRQAEAVAELEYEIVGIDVVDGGNGYIVSEPPRVDISPPEEDPDWFVDKRQRLGVRTYAADATAALQVTVAEMLQPEGSIKHSSSHPADFSSSLLTRLQNNPLDLLPPSNLPILKPAISTSEVTYIVPDIPPPPQFVNNLSPRYRAVDPLFGGVGSVPVTKAASALSASEYARLSLSGAVCSVVVRTLLNPLELIKTKQQLENDEELLIFARERVKEKKLFGERNSEHPSVEEITKPSNVATSPQRQTKPGGVLSIEEEEFTPKSPMVGELELRKEAELDVSRSEKNQAKVGTIDLLGSLVALRGPLALFQSADITFLASVVFGSFGFGATELFRRYFTAAFINDAAGGGRSAFVLLLAASLATVITSAAGAPFELLRVRSMGQLESQKWTIVLQEYLSQQGSKDHIELKSGGDDEFKLTDLRPRDIMPLFAGFWPTVSRELPFGSVKFLTFDILTSTFIGIINRQAIEGALPLQVGVGPTGLAVSAIAGGLAGIAGAIISHPADLILTYTSASRTSRSSEDTHCDDLGRSEEQNRNANDGDADWLTIVKDLLSKEGGVSNLFVGLPARATFFFLVIGLQFFLYDFVKGYFRVGIDDLDLVLDVFYTVRAGLE